jgi:DHA2 family multidrug resistance protein
VAASDCVISRIGSLNVGQFVATSTTIASLIETLGIGISLVSAVLSNMMQVNHAELAERLTPSSQAVQTQMPGLLTGNPQVVAIINGLVQQQSAILSYLDDFWLMMLLSMGSIPLILLLRGPKKGKDVAPKTKEELAVERAHAMAE